MAIIDIKGLSNWQTTAITLTTSGLPYVLTNGILTNRKTLVIYNVSDTNVYVGGPNVTTTNGILITPSDKIVFDSSAGLYAVCGTAGKIINILEGA